MIPIWCLSIFVIGMVLGMLALVANLIAEDLNGVINPCLNRGIYNVSNKHAIVVSVLDYSVEISGTTQCKNNGILIKKPQPLGASLISSYACRCPMVQLVNGLGFYVIDVLHP